MQRISIVKNIEVSSVTSASTFIVGDTVKITARTRAIALQRQVAKFFANEGEFADFPMFTKEIVKPSLEGRVNMCVRNESPYIKVNNIDVIGVAEASTMQIGSTRILDVEARIKHFRQYVTDSKMSIKALDLL
ncbi:MAG: spore germination protein GerPE [Paenibacillaceae bacterium]